MRNYGQISLILFLSTTLTSCMVGPNFHSPLAPNTSTYTESPQPKKTVSTPKAGAAGKSQYFVSGRDIPAEWWRIFHSTELDDLICAGLKNSPNLAAAEAALRAAKETVTAQVGLTLFPNVNAQINGERQRDASASFGGGSGSNVYNLYNVNLGVSYTLDVFGGARRQIEALLDQVDYQRFQMEAAYLSLTSNIVTTAITAASLRAQIAATNELIQAQQQTLTIVEAQFRVGGVSRANILTQETTLAQLRATLPPLQQQLAAANHLLSVLIGELPSEDRIPRFSLARLNLPSQLPLSLPSLLVRQRPDVRASEALFAAASAKVGVATANLFPQFTLNVNYGWTSTQSKDLLSPSNSIWSFGYALTQPIFNAGGLQAQRRAAIDTYQQAAMQYKQTVLQAFQNVADTLRALQHDAETLRAQKNAEIASHDSLILTQKQFRLGGVNYLSLLTAQQQYQQAKIARIQAEASRYNDTAALFQSLGGGWWNRNCCGAPIQAQLRTSAYKA
jgi:NodT family efflux transporter outer membrane factor (OMF) lipoprotein